MSRKKLLKRMLLTVLIIAIAFGVYYAWNSLPIISGYSAKNACSCVFLQGRTKEQIKAEELGSFPLSLGSIDIDLTDSSVTGSVLGLAKRKAIFRNGLGCTLVNGYSENELRAQRFTIPLLPASDDTSRWLLPMMNDTNKTNGYDQARLDSAVAYLFNHEFNKSTVHTRAALVVYRGEIVAERYADGFDRHTPFLGWSMAKSITSALTGILVKQGKLQLHAAAPVPQWREDVEKQKILLEHLLQQTSGLEFVENYKTYSHVTNMLFNKGDMAGYVAGLDLKEKPGTVFNYSSGNSNLLSYIVRSTVGEKDYHAFPYQSLFHKTGMQHTLLEPDASGTFVGSSYVYASVRDYARFGLLYLNDGVWNGERLLPEGWVKQSTTPPAANKLKNYGYQFWLNGVDKNDPSKPEYPTAPADMFYADGFNGQRIYIIPSKELVIVRMGLNNFDEHGFLKEIMEAVGK
jgi:CubicO group peptidase (beta-lactamase class C family)